MFCQVEKKEQKAVRTVPKQISHKKRTMTNPNIIQRSKSTPYLFMNPAPANQENISKKDVIQCATAIQYANTRIDGDLQQTSIISAVNHYQRVALRQGERDNADRIPAGLGVAGLICNHHAPYARIANAIVANYLIGQNVIVAISSINNVINLLNNVGAGFANIPFVRFNANPFIMTQEFDDAIANIANDPRNLFYSPNHRGDAGGTQLDWPSNAPNGPCIVPGHYMFTYSAILIANNMC